MNNYLLQNIVLSEDYTRGPVLEENDESYFKTEGCKKKISLRIIYKDSTCEFTGTCDREDTEKDAKLAISKICVALPGGVMSIHAFLNVIENIIRNSAKYLKKK